ncbi:hypothetical protein ACFSCX_20270 [Bacillus salitolerans]|uniref:DUF4030 domain-containing protein n=1 Tax=Bacillus salitolerans TaxID=1437434 RepID=A0ABW4LXE9_9BACI
MLKKILMIAGILIVGITIFSLLNKPLEADTIVANKENQKPSISKEEDEEISTMKLVTEKIYEKYDTLKFVVGTSSKKELRIQVQGDKNDFDSIKNDIELIAKDVINSSPIKEFKVIVEWVDIPAVKGNIKIENKNKELSLLTHTLMVGLKQFDVIGDIGTEYQKNITIQTSLKGNGEKAQKSALEIEEKVNQLLTSKELSSVSKIESYKIRILNTDGKAIN